MSPVSIQTEEMEKHGAQIREGSQASKFKECCFPWVDKTILNAMEEKAMKLLRSSTTDEERIEAKQLSLAAHEFRRVVEGLIGNAKASKQILTEISTQEGEDGP